jgi:hypothetical protein
MQKEIASHLLDIGEASEILTLSDKIAKRAENAKKRSLEKFKLFIRLTITAVCSNEFTLEMLEKVPVNIRHANDFDQHMTNLDYLQEVICWIFASEYYPNHQDSGTFPYNDFIMPRQGYHEGEVFYQKFRSDFEQIEKKFGLEINNVGWIKAGYACRFEKKHP